MGWREVIIIVHTYIEFFGAGGSLPLGFSLHVQKDSMFGVCARVLTKIDNECFKKNNFCTQLYQLHHYSATTTVG